MKIESFARMGLKVFGPLCLPGTQFRKSITCLLRLREPRSQKGRRARRTTGPSNRAGACRNQGERPGNPTAHCLPPVSWDVPHDPTWVRRLWSWVIGWLFIGIQMGGVATAQQAVTIDFRNHIPGVLDAPVFDLDGSTRLAGELFLAQLYISWSDDPWTFIPVPGASPFQHGEKAGYWVPRQLDLSDFVAPGDRILVQVRAWELVQVFPFPQRGIFGASRPISLVLTNFPVPLLGLESFKLQPESLWVKREGDQFIVNWVNKGARYELQVTSSLRPPIAWSVVPLGTNLPGFDEVISVTNKIVEPMRFFRLQRWRR